MLLTCVRCISLCMIAHIIGITANTQEIFRISVPPSLLEDTTSTNYLPSTAQEGEKESLEGWDFGMKVLSLFEDGGLSSGPETGLLQPRMMSRLISGASNDGSVSGRIANLGKSLKTSLSTNGPRLRKWLSSMKLQDETDAESMANGEKNPGNRPPTPHPSRGVLRSLSDGWNRLSFRGKSDSNRDRGAREGALGQDASSDSKTASQRKDSKGGRKEKKAKDRTVVKINSGSDSDREIGGERRKKRSGSVQFTEHDVAIDSGGESGRKVGVGYPQPPSRETSPPPSPGQGSSPQKGPSPQPSPKKGSTPPPSPPKGSAPPSTPPPRPKTPPSNQVSPSQKKGPSPQPSPKKGPSPQPSPKKGSTPPSTPPKGSTPPSTPESWKKSPSPKQKSHPRSPSPTAKQPSPPPSPPKFPLPPAQVRSSPEREESKPERERSRSPEKMPAKAPSYTRGWSSASIQEIARRAAMAREQDDQRRAAGTAPTGRQRPITSAELGGGTTWVASSYGEIPPTIGFVQKETPKTADDDWAKRGYDWGKWGREEEAPIRKAPSPPRSGKPPSPPRWEPPPPSQPPPQAPSQAPSRWATFKPPQLPEIQLEEKKKPNFDDLCKDGKCSIVYRDKPPAYMLQG